MELLAVVVATAVPVSIAVAVCFWSWRVQSDFFRALVASAGHARPESPLIRLGLGLDEVMLWTSDWRPAARALSQPIADHQLDLKRLRARHARLVAFAALPIVLLIALVTSSLASGMWFIPLAAGAVAWGFGWSAAGTAGFWYSRPEVVPADGLTWAAYLIPVAIVGGTLLLAALILVLAGAIRGG
jgi:hypothetical protein